MRSPTRKAMKCDQLKSLCIHRLLFILLCLYNPDKTSCAPNFPKTQWWETNEDIQILREYLRIPSVHPNPDYGPCVAFLKRQVEPLGLPLKIYYATAANKPTVVITWEGTNPDLTSIVLNSHMDVVPVSSDGWTYPPFGAEVDNEGRIFARGAQDMKSLGTAYLAAIRRLQKAGFQPKRTVHVFFVPDEEIGSFDGMRAFVKTPEFQSLNVGMALDEGHVTSGDKYFLYYGEKTTWQPTFTVKGTHGHASLPVENTAGEGFNAIMGKLMERRQIEMDKMKNGVHMSNITSINLTKVSGGTQTNVLPDQLSASFDIRLAPGEDIEAFGEQIERWIKESGASIELTFEEKDDQAPVTPLNDSNRFWVAFREALADLQFNIEPAILTGASDMRFLRALNIPAFGFNPMNDTPLLIHNDNEFVWADKYLEAIEAYMKIIEKVTDFV